MKSFRKKGLASIALLLSFVYTNVLLGAVAVTWPPIGGSSYSVPQAGETGWANLTNYLVALQNAQGTTSQKVAIRTATTTPVTVVSATDAIVVTNLASPGAVAVSLPAGVAGQYFAIVDGKGDAQTNNITITPNGSETIQGAGTYVINKNRAAIILAFTGGNWSIYGEFNSFSSGGQVLINPMDGAGQMIYGGVSGTPTKLAAGSSSQILQSNGTSAPSWISTLSIAQGGTGQTSKSAAFDALSPMNGGGQIIYGSSPSGSGTALSAGSANQVLQSNGASAPSWVGSLLLADGSNSAPSYSFASDPDTGSYSSGANSYSISTNGTARITVTTASTSSTLPIRGPDGSTSSASFGWTSDADTGFYRKGSGNVGILSDGNEIASYSTAGQWIYGLTGSSNSSLTYRYYVPTAASTTPSAVVTSPYLEFTSQCTNGCPGLLGNNNTSSADTGLFMIGATKDGNTSGDMRFDVRENDNSAFSTLSNNAFRWSTFGTNLMTMTRAGALTVGPSSSANQNLTVNGYGYIQNTGGNSAEITLDTSGGTGSPKAWRILSIGSAQSGAGGVGSLVFRNQTDTSSKAEITSSGAVTFPSIHNIGSGNVTSGTYTPTVSNTNNITVNTVRQHNYSRTGNIVTVSGILSVTITTTNTDTSFEITLPVSTSNFGNVYQASGTAILTNSNNNAKDAGSVIGSSGTQRVEVSFQNASVATSGLATIYYVFTFEVQ